MLELEKEGKAVVTSLDIAKRVEGDADAGNLYRCV